MNESPNRESGAGESVPGPAAGPVTPTPSDSAAAATQQHLPGSPVASTGDAQVDAALTALEGLEELPPGEQADVIESVHDRLRSTLAELDTAASTASGSAAGPAGADSAVAESSGVNGPDHSD